MAAGYSSSDHATQREGRTRYRADERFTLLRRPDSTPFYLAADVQVAHACPAVGPHCGAVSTHVSPA
jgi:hypothetical protein